MSWTVQGARLDTAELNGTTLVYQRVRFNKDIVLRGLRSWFVAYNDPTFTSLSFRIYSDRASAPGKLLYTSDAVTKVDLLDLGNGVKEAYWNFDLQTFKGTDWFHFVPVASGYTGTAGSHLAWRKGWPDPVYRTNFTPTYSNWGTAPYMIYFIGAEL